jgi:hypothetical protein
MDPSYLGRPIQAPTANKPQGIMTPRMFLIILGMVGAIVVGILLMFASSDSTGTLQQRLSARQATTLKLVADGQKNITDPDLKKLNSELSIVLQGDSVAVGSALTAAGMKKVEKTITADEADTQTFEELKAAKLNGQYDTTYRRVMTQKLESLRALLQELHGATKIRELKPSLASEYQHLGLYLEAFEKLGA